jgi:hypothetical protein
MATAAERAHSLIQPTMGVESLPGDWHTVTQDQIDSFARTTLDNQSTIRIGRRRPRDVSNCEQTRESN